MAKLRQICWLNQSLRPGTHRHRSSPKRSSHRLGAHRQLLAALHQRPPGVALGDGLIDLRGGQPDRLDAGRMVTAASEAFYAQIGAIRIDAGKSLDAVVDEILAGAAVA